MSVQRKHWFFDFDGTLCDTQEDIRLAWIDAIKGLGRECPQFEKVYKIGPTIEEVTYMLFDDATPELVEQIRNEFKKCYDVSDFPFTKPYPWIQSRLDELKARGCHLYIATNKRYNPMHPLMKKMGWLDLFDGYFSFDMYEGERLKKSELLKRVLAERGISPDDAVMVGDTKGDVDSGKANGMYTIGCTWGYGSREELAGADEIHDAP